MQVLIVGTGEKESPVREADLSYLVSCAIKQIILKQNLSRSKFHNREMVATVAKNAKSLIAIAGFRMDSNVVKCY